MLSKCPKATPWTHLWSSARRCRMRLLLVSGNTQVQKQYINNRYLSLCRFCVPCPPIVLSLLWFALWLS